MNVIWAEQASKAVKQTVNYIAAEHGRKKMEEFMQKVNAVGDLLGDNPYLGPTEPLLTNKPIAYRSVVVAKKNKIVYRINDDRIEVVDFWDVRREPKALAKQVKE